MFEKRKAEKAAAEHQLAVELSGHAAGQAYEALEASRLQAEGTSVPGVLMKKGELPYQALQGAHLIEPRRAPGQWSGASKGVSFKVAKGVRYHVGQSKGHFVQGEERPTPIDTGLFVVTSQRCIFVGVKRTMEWAYAKLIGFSLDGDGVAMFNVSNRQKASGVYYGTQYESVFDAAIAAAIARFAGEESHQELVSEMEANYAEAYQRWKAIEAAPATALSDPNAGAW